MKTEMVKITEIQKNPNNPRLIKDNKFEKLVQSIKEFPEMLNLRPIVVNNEMVVLGGNMRLAACKEAGLKNVPIIKADDLTEEQQKEFIIKDNVSFGEWDWDMLGNEWEEIELGDWGLDVWQPEQDLLLIDDDDSLTLDVKPKASDDDYSVFELIMLHENKLTLIDTLNKVKNNFLFEKQEEALMEIIRKYNQI